MGQITIQVSINFIICKWNYFENPLIKVLNLAWSFYRLLCNAEDSSKRKLVVCLENGPQVLSKPVGDHKAMPHAFDLVRSRSVEYGEIQIWKLFLLYIIVD